MRAKSPIGGGTLVRLSKALFGVSDIELIAKMADDADDNDLAMAVVNMICQTVGMIAAGATGEDPVVPIGKLAAFPAVEAGGLVTPRRFPV